MSQQGRRPDTSRIESFSDAVLAIILTLLVLDLLPTEPEAPEQYLSDWPKYLAYLTAFFTVAAVWVNHHALFGRLKRADGLVFVLNLFILLGTSLVPWPAAAVSLALSGSNRSAQAAAVVLYATITVLICAPWAVLDRHVAHRPGLTEAPDDPAWFRRHARVVLAAAGAALAAAGLSTWSPLAALVVLLLVVVSFVLGRTRETRSR